MRKSLTLFFSCPGGSVTPIQEFFRCAGMSYTASELSENPYDFEMVTRLNQRLHTTIYGFAEGTLGYCTSGQIYRNRRVLLPDVSQLPEEWVHEGITAIQTLTGSAPVTGLFQNGLVLFHDYWHHVLSHFPEISVHQLFILQPPGEILFHLVRQSSERPAPVEILDFLMAYYLRLLQIRKQWKGSSRVIHPTSTTYASDLRRALEQNRLLREGMPHIEHVVPVPSGGEFPILNHPIELTYEKILASFM